jgi:hypothetical protein
MRHAGLNRAAEQIDDLVHRADDRNIHEAALDLGPFIAGFATESHAVLVKRLVQDPNDHQTSVSAA